MTVDRLRNATVNEFYDNSTMLNVALNIEYFLCEDVLLYPYKNWYRGELVSGPYIKRYSVSVIFRYDYKDMPDPEGALVLKRFGVSVSYKKVNEKNGASWYIIMLIPRNLVTDENQRKQLSIIDNLLDLESLEAASDDNMENETSLGDFGAPPESEMDFESDDTPPEPEIE